MALSIAGIISIALIKIYPSSIYHDLNTLHVFIAYSRNVVYAELFKSRARTHPFFT